MIRKTYNCDICNKSNILIRSRIKNRNSNHYGKYACPVCASKENKYRISKLRRRDRTINHSSFFKEQVEKIIKNRLCCEECGERLKGTVSEVAHIIKKSTNPEISNNSNNILFLCQPCHSKFDYSLDKRKGMKVFKTAKDRYNKYLKDEVVRITNEVLNYE